MVMKLNKSAFINELSTHLSYSKDKCNLINEILENNFFISKKSKDKIINKLSCELNIDEEEALNIYNVSVQIINNEVKNKLKHPFKNKKAN